MSDQSNFAQNILKRLIKKNITLEVNLENHVDTIKIKRPVIYVPICLIHPLYTVHYRREILTDHMLFPASQK